MALDRVVFLHIPHTAGTYFKQTLRCWGCACESRASRERDAEGCARVRASTFGPVERRRLHAAGAAGCVDQLLKFSAAPKRLVELHHFDLSFARLLEGRGFAVATIARHPLEVWLSHFGRQRPRAAPPAVAPDEFEAFVARSFGGRLGLFHDSALMWWSGCDLRRAQLVDAAPWGSHSCAAAALRRRDEAGAALVRDDLAAVVAADGVCNTSARRSLLSAGGWAPDDAATAAARLAPAKAAAATRALARVALRNAKRFAFVGLADAMGATLCLFDRAANASVRAAPPPRRPPPTAHPQLSDAQRAAVLERMRDDVWLFERIRDVVRERMRRAGCEAGGGGAGGAA